MELQSEGQWPDHAFSEDYATYGQLQDLRSSRHAMAKARAPAKAKRPRMFPPVKLQQVMECTGLDTKLQCECEQGPKSLSYFFPAHFTNPVMYKSLEEAAMWGPKPEP